MTPVLFDDVLGLGALDLARHRHVVFCGRSGAGKSTAIRFLIEQHPQLQSTRAELEVIEELYDWRDWRRFLSALRGRRRALIASHWPIWLHRLLAPLARTRVFDLNAPTCKISNALARRAIVASPSAVNRFCARFGANYTDLGLVLERYPGLDFDRALKRFERECVVTETRTDGR